MEQKLTENDAQRNWGIDALRMLAMFMVLILHILRQDGVLSASQQFPVQYKAAWLLEIAAYCAVNCYALISGYVGVRSLYRYANIVGLWLRVVFYTVIITGIFQVVMPEAVGTQEWIKAIFPVMNGQYWFFTAYFAMFFFVPVANAAAEKLTKKQYTALLMGLFIVMSFLPTAFRNDAFQMNSGYCAAWLLVLYMAGGYLKRYGLLEQKAKLFWFAAYLTLIMATWLSKLVLETHGHNGNVLVSYTSPTIVFAAVALVQLFKLLRIPTAAVRWIKLFAPAAFSVYLIHAHSLMWGAIKKRLPVFTAYHPCKLLATVVLDAAIIFVACLLIDILRQKLFKVLKIKELLAVLENRLLGPLWKEKRAPHLPVTTGESEHGKDHTRG